MASLNNNLNQMPRNRHFFLWAVLALIVAGGLITGEYLYLQKDAADAKTAADISEQQQLREIQTTSRNFTTIVTKAQETAAQTTSAVTRTIAQSTEAYGTFMMATPADRAKAVQLVKDRYSQSSNPLIQAAAINQLIEFVGASRNQDVLDAVFKTKPFDAYYVENDLAASIGALGEKSFSLYPTVIGAGYSMMGDIGPITNFGKTYKLTDAEKTAHAAAILAKIPRLQAGLDAEAALLVTKTADPLLTYEFYNWNSLAYGALARVDSAKYADKAIASYETLFSTFEAAKVDGKPLAILALRAPMDHMFYAQLLIKLGGETNLAKARVHIQAIMDMINHDPELHKSQYVQFLKDVGAGQGSTQQSSIKMLQRAATAYPPFKDFVKQYGINLQ